MPRLVAGGPGKRKFWHAWVEDTELKIKFGKLGTSGEAQQKSFPTAEAAAKELAKLVKQKLAKGYADAAWRFDFDESGLEVVQIVDHVPRREDASLAHEVVGKGAWSDAVWHGDHAFALARAGDGYRAGLVDRAGKPAVWKPFEPPIVAATVPFGFSHDDARLLVTAGGHAFVIDCKTHARETIAIGADEVVSAALLRDRVALLRKHGANVRLELYAGGSLATTIPCHRQDVLYAFGGGRGLIVGFSPGDEHFDQATRSWPQAHFVGVDGGLRLLGTFGMAISDAFEHAGRSYYTTNAIGVIEICKIDEALREAAKRPALDTLP